MAIKSLSNTNAIATQLHGGRFQSTSGWNNSVFNNTFLRNITINTGVGGADYTRTDVSVVGNTYDPNGNGGRKLVQLDNGWLIAASKDTSNTVYFYRSTDNGATWSQLTFTQSGYTNVIYFSLVARGNRVNCFITQGGENYGYLINFDATTVTNANLHSTRQIVDTGQTLMAENSLAMNDAKTELHAVWSCQSPGYPNSFNIRYVKGVFNKDGTVTMGVVEQVTAISSTANPSYAKTPTIVVDKNGTPCIIYSSDSNLVPPASIQNSLPSIVMMKRSNELTAFTGFHTSWTFKTIHVSPNNTNYVQYAPSAVFVPRSINGLTNGRIWVTWHGLDNKDATQNNIRLSYSDDGGLTWSAMQKLTTGNVSNQTFPSITATKDNKIFILWNGYVTGIAYNVRRISYDGTSWSAITTVVSDAGSSIAGVSTLADLNITTTSPPMILRNSATSKVTFSGTWSTHKIAKKNVVDIGSPISFFSRGTSVVTSAANALSTNGNSGRKIVKLSNGWFIAAVDGGQSNSIIYLYISKDGGGTWSEWLNINTFYENGYALTCKETFVYVAVTHAGHGKAWVHTLDALSDYPGQIYTSGPYVTTVDDTITTTNASYPNGTSITCNPLDNTLHVAYSVKTSAYANGNNIRYVKGTINSNGSVTWNAPEQVTTANSGSPQYNHYTPCVVIKKDGYPIILMASVIGSDGMRGIRYASKTLTGWDFGGQQSVYGGAVYQLTNYNQWNPCATVDSTGTIHVVWHGIDATDSTVNNIRYTKSTDNGATWATPTKLTSGNTYHQENPTIVYDDIDLLNVYWEGGTVASGSNRRIRTVRYVGANTWNPIEDLTANTTTSTLGVHLCENVRTYSRPVALWRDYQFNTVIFDGAWSEGGNYNGTVTKTILPGDIDKWGTLLFDRTTPNNTTVTCDILSARDSVLMSNVQSGVDLSSINPVDHPSLKLRFSLQRTNAGADTPTVSNISVTYEGEKSLGDSVTGKKYKLIMSNGGLVMEEI